MDWCSRDVLYVFIGRRLPRAFVRPEKRTETVVCITNRQQRCSAAEPYFGKFDLKDTENAAFAQRARGVPQLR